MRLKVRRSVDLPQPDGPMKAVTRPSGMASVMCLRAWNLPYHTLRSFTAIFVERPSRFIAVMLFRSMLVMFVSFQIRFNVGRIRLSGSGGVRAG